MRPLLPPTITVNDYDARHRNRGIRSGLCRGDLTRAVPPWVPLELTLSACPSDPDLRLKPRSAPGGAVLSTAR